MITISYILLLKVRKKRKRKTNSPRDKNPSDFLSQQFSYKS